MIGEQPRYTTNFDPQPYGYAPKKDKHPSTKNNCQNTRWPGDAEPKSFDHHRELLLKDFALRLWFVLGFSVINKKSNDVEKSGKPGDYENDMKGLYI